MNKTDKYLLYSSVFAIFSEAFFFNFIIDWKLLYLILGINLPILLLKLKKIKVNNTFILITIFLFFHGLFFSIFYFTPFYKTISQLVGIIILGTYYFLFFKYYKYETIVQCYLKITFTVVIIGFPILFFGLNSFQPDKFHSIMSEAQHYDIVVIPAMYYLFFNYNKIKSSIIAFSIVLSTSSTGFIGLFLSFLFAKVNKKIILNIFILIPVFIGLFYLLYNNYEEFKVRIDDTTKEINIYETKKFYKWTNVSSYVYLKSYYVSRKNFSEHPFGTGLGTFEIYHDKYLSDLKIPEYIYDIKSKDLNKADANSLALRIISDLGVFGIFLILVFLYYSIQIFKNKTQYKPLLIGLLIYFILKLFRDGHYFPPELYFFVWMYFFGIKQQPQWIKN